MGSLTVYGMLLSRSWGTKRGGSLQLDMTYATIPIFGGQFTRMYRETRLAYTVSDPQNPNNYPAYVIDQDLGNCILSLDDDLDDCIEEENRKIEKPHKSINSRDGIWKMFFYAASSCEGAWERVLLFSPRDEFVIPFSYRLQWDIDYTNNVCEYKAIFLGLEASRKLQIENIIVYCNAELIIKKIKKQYQSKHPRLMSYINCASDLIDNFFSSFNIYHIPE